MKVYKLRFPSGSSFCIFNNPEDMRVDLECFADEGLDVDQAIQTVKSLELGGKIRHSLYHVDCYLMTDYEYSMLPEFKGW